MQKRATFSTNHKGGCHWVMYVLVDSFVVGCAYLVPPSGLIVDPSLNGEMRARTC
jgi:hypothetical protein